MEALVRGLQRTRRYWFEDGLVEILVGACFAGAGALLVAGKSALVPALLLLAILVGGSLIHRLRIHLTYPRTGFVAFRRPRGWSAGLSVTAGVVIAAGVGWLGPLLPDLAHWYAALQGAGSGAVLLWASARTGLSRLTALAAISAATGLAASLAAGGIAGWGAAL
jgi:hypothetical protein